MAGGASERVGSDFGAWKILKEAQAGGLRRWRTGFWELAGIDFSDFESVGQTNEFRGGRGLAGWLRLSRGLFGVGR